MAYKGPQSKRRLEFTSAPRNATSTIATGVVEVLEVAPRRRSLRALTLSCMRVRDCTQPEMSRMERSVGSDVGDDNIEVRRTYRQTYS